MTRRYVQIEDGDWFEPSDQRRYYDQCCDCGLTHELNFKVVDGKVLFRTRLRPRETAAARRRVAIKRRIAELGK